MKNSPLTTLLLIILTLSALASVYLCWAYVSNARELRSLQNQAAMVNNNRALIQALANETVEYSKTHPSIDPVLEAAGIKPKSGGSTSNAPAAKSTK